MKKNIGIYISNFDYGGVSKFISNLSKALIREGITAHIITLNNSTNENIEKLNRNKDIIKYLKKNNIKTIITNGWFDQFKINILCKRYRYNIKTIQVLHSDLSQLDMENKSIKGRVKRFLVKNSFDNSDICIAVSKAVQSEINDSGLFKKKFIHIYNPVIDERKHYSTKKGFVDIENKEEINIVMVGWIRKLKGQDIAIKAISKLNDRRIKLNIIGGIKDKGYYEELKELIKDKNLKQNVKFLGVKENAIDIIGKMDILILASRAEALPTVLIEALACEVLIISSDCNHGPKEILKNGECGVLFKVNDHEALAKNINDIVSSNKIYNSYKKICLKQVEQFTYSSVNLEYKKILEV